LKSKRFEIEPEITCKILKKGYKIKEVPISYNPRKTGKKIGWIDGFKAIFAILKYRIT
ncbi:MAG: glycosyltransferase family 2 protein, partial [Candidatus Omnitrophica bacterium]|nr:glycosyltransferase family 2 protein [Candidatus Omnitrophota bacterium]